MRKPVSSRKFQRDLKNVHKRGLPIKRLHAAIQHIAENGNAPALCRPHKLKGMWAGFWECHIAPDWLLIYGVSETEVLLYRTGSHADLFE
jgi:mRNA interferase YafQ